MADHIPFPLPGGARALPEAAPDGHHARAAAPVQPMPSMPPIPSAPPAGALARGLAAVALLMSPKAAARKEREERQAALAEGRRALARLRAARQARADANPLHDPLHGIPDLAPSARAIETLEAAVLSLDRIAEQLAQALDLAEAARACTDEGARALLAERYDEVRGEIDHIARTAYGGRMNLLDGLGGCVQAPLDGRGRASIAIPGTDVTTGPGGLALPPPETAFQEMSEIAAVSAALEAASYRCTAIAERFEMEATVLAARIGTPRHSI